AREFHIIGIMLCTPHSGHKSFLRIIGILAGVFIVVYYNVFSGGFVLFVIWFVVFIRIVLIKPHIGFREKRPVKQMGFRVLLAIVIGQKLAGVVRVVFVYHRAGIGADGKHQPA